VFVVVCPATTRSTLSLCNVESFPLPTLTYERDREREVLRLVGKRKREKRVLNLSREREREREFERGADSHQEETERERRTERAALILTHPTTLALLRCVCQCVHVVCVFESVFVRKRERAAPTLTYPTALAVFYFLFLCRFADTHTHTHTRSHTHSMALRALPQTNRRQQTCCRERRLVPGFMSLSPPPPFPVSFSHTHACAPLASVHTFSHSSCILAARVSCADRSHAAAQAHCTVCVMCVFVHACARSLKALWSISLLSFAPHASSPRCPVAPTSHKSQDV